MKELFDGIWNMPKDQFIGSIENAIAGAAVILLMAICLCFFVYAIWKWAKGR